MCYLGARLNVPLTSQIDEAGVERSPPTFAEIASDGVLAIVAGSDTTATILSSLFWALLSLLLTADSKRKLIAIILPGKMSYPLHTALR